MQGIPGFRAQRDWFFKDEKYVEKSQAQRQLLEYTVGALAFFKLESMYLYMIIFKQNAKYTKNVFWLLFHQRFSMGAILNQLVSRLSFSIFFLHICLISYFFGIQEKKLAPASSMCSLGLTNVEIFTVGAI
jgi:hypothetical protein